MPRYFGSEKKSEEELANLIGNPMLDEHTAVILDSGGSHSVAMAARLAATVGRQPVIMFDAIPLSNGVNRQAVQESAVMLYFAQHMKALKDLGRISPNSPPVFVLDCHRSDRSFGDAGMQDNGYRYTALDFPTADDFKQHGIKRIIYLNEGDKHGIIDPTYQSTDRLQQDLKAVAEAWASEGLEMLYTGISPTKPDRTHDVYLGRDPWGGSKII